MLEGRALCDLASHEGRAEVRVEARVGHLELARVAISDRPVRAMLTHVLDVTIHSLLELPVGTDFGTLLLRHVRERIALRDAGATLDLGELLGVHWQLLLEPRLGGLEGVRPLRSLQVLDLASNLAPAGHDLLHLYVTNDAALLLILNLRVLFLKPSSLFLQIFLLIRTLILTHEPLRPVEVLPGRAFLEQEELGGVGAYFATLLPERMKLMSALSRHRSPLERVFALTVKLFQVLPDIVESIGTLGRDDSLELELFGTFLLHRHELDDVKVGIGKIFSAGAHALASFLARFLRTAGSVLSVSLLINFFLRLLYLLFNMRSLLAVILVLPGGRPRFLLRLLQLMCLHTLNTLQNVEEFFLFGIEEARRVRFILFVVLILHDALSTLRIALQQVQLLVRHLMINAINFAST